MVNPAALRYRENMSSTLTELELFHRFIGEKQISNGSRALAIQEAVKAFRDYQDHVAHLRQEIQPALEGSLRGECRPFDAEAPIEQIIEQLASHGIAE